MEVENLASLWYWDKDFDRLLLSLKISPRREVTEQRFGEVRR